MDKVNVVFLNDGKILDLIENRRNVNPIKDFNYNEDTKYNEEVEEAISKLLNDPAINNMVDSNAFKQVVSQGVEVSIDKDVAIALKNAGLVEIREMKLVNNQKNNYMTNSNANEELGQTQTLEEKSAEKKEIKADKKEFAPSSAEDIPLEVRQMNEEIEKLEKALDENKENEKVKELIEKQIEEKAAERNEIYGKMYYLTPERMLENLQKMNGGRLWKTLFNSPEKRYAVERAYLTCSDPNQLTNPDFLTNRIEQFLPEGENVQGLKGIQKLLLANTYVGYHVEERAPEANIDEPKVDESVVNPAMIEFPAFVSDMPEDLKAEIRENGYKLMNQAMQDVILNNSAYTAICVISDTDSIASKALGELEKQAGNDTKGLAIKAYIKTLDTQFEKDAKKDLGEKFDLAVTFSGEELSNDSVRADTIQLLKIIDKNGQENIVDNAVKTVDIDIIIKDTQDIEKLKKMTSSFGEVNTEVNVNYAIDTQDTAIMNELRNDVKELDSGSQSNVKFYEDISAEEAMQLDHQVSDTIEMGANALMTMTAYNELSKLRENSMEEMLDSLIDTNENEKEFYEMYAGYENNDSAVADIARQVNDKNNDITFEEAVYRLSLEADIPIEMAEDLLIDAGARALEEDDFDPMNDFFNRTNNDEQNG